MTKTISRRVQFIILFCLAALTFVSFPKTFFQQDEWQFFGAAVTALSSSHPIINTILPFGGQLTHFYPLAKLLFLSEYVMFNVNFTPFALINFVVHFFNGILVYLILQKLTKKDLLAFLATGLFLVNSFSHQALTWVLAGVTTLPATFFLLLSIFYFLIYKENKKQKYYILSLCFFFISLLFKEITFFLFFLIPIGLKSMYHSFRKLKISLLLLTLVGSLYITLRLLIFIFDLKSPQPEPGDMNMPPIQSFIFRLFSVPLKGIAQSFFPQKFLIDTSDRLIQVAYPQFINADGLVAQYISQTIVLDIICYFLSLLICMVCFLMFRYLQKKDEFSLGLTVLASLLFMVVSFFPFIFIPGRVGYFSIFEPRNLYIAGVASSLIMAIFFYTLSNLFVKFVKRAEFRVLFILLFFLPVLIMHVNKTRADLKDLKYIGEIRKSLLTTIKNDYPNLPAKAVIFTQSDRSYYGMPSETKILPVQSGFGRMVAIWYQSEEKFPACLYEEQFLHDLLSQGYKFCEGRGFGYFREYGLMLEEIENNQFSADDVIAYTWNGNSNEFLNSTGKIREQLNENLSR